MKINMIYLAAGNSRRFFINGKHTNKLLQDIHGKPLYQYGLEQLKEAAKMFENCHIYVVTQYPEIFDHCSKEDCVMALFSEESKKGMSYSIRNALQNIKAEENSCYLFQAADQPFIRAETIVRFISEFLRSGKKAGSVMYGEVPGNPGIFRQDYVEELKALTGDQGGRAVMRRHPEEIFEFQLPVEKERKDVDNFADFQDACEQKGQKREFRIYAVGSGGKTSLLHYLAQKYSRKGKKVLILTTTHMMQEEGMILLDEDPELFIEQVWQAFDSQLIVVAGKKEGSEKKFTWIGDDLYHKIASYADVICIEADGSKRLPAKFPGEEEPVVYPDADQICVVFGLSALGQKMKDACHRYLLADQIAEADEIIDESIAAQILQKGYLERMRAQYPDAETILVLNQADDDCLRERAVKLANLAGEDAKILSLKKEFEKIANFIEQK